MPDAITRLANRHEFLVDCQRLEDEARAAQELFAVVLVHVDSLEAICYWYGHLFVAKLVDIVAEALMRVESPHETASKVYQRDDAQFAVAVRKPELAAIRAFAEALRAAATAVRPDMRRTGVLDRHLDEGPSERDSIREINLTVSLGIGVGLGLHNRVGLDVTSGVRLRQARAQASVAEREAELALFEAHLSGMNGACIRVSR